MYIKMTAYCCRSAKKNNELIVLFFYNIPIKN